MTPHLIQYILVDLIDPDPGQPRKHMDPDALQRHAETIRAHGLQRPIRVRPCGDRFTIVFGERSWRASRMAGLDAVPCMIEDAATTTSDLRIRQLLENCARENLRPLELAAAIEQVIADSGLTGADVARLVGFSEGHVSKLRATLKLPQDVREKIERGELAFSSAYELVKLDDASAQREAAAKATHERLSRECLAHKIRRGQRALRMGKRRVTLPVAPGCSVAVIATDLSLASLAEWFTKLAERARQAESRGLDLPAFVDSLRAAKALPKAGAA